MKFITDIEEKKYEEFVLNSNKSHFLQSTDWGTFSKDNKKIIPHYVALLNDKEKVVASALLLEKSLPLGYTYFYSPRGLVLDYNDKELVKEFTGKIKEYAKTRKCIYLKIDPDIKLQDLTIDGEVIDSSNNYDLVEYLKTIGYKHLGFNKAFEHNEPRYTFRLNLKEGLEYVTNNFHQTTKKVLNKGNLYGLEIYKNDEKYIDDFYSTMKDTANRENISIYSKTYYLNFYKYLHKNNHSDIYIVYIDKNKTLEIINKNIEDLTTKKDKLTIENKIKELENQISKLVKLKKEIEELKEEKYPLSSIITAKYGNKVWTVHGGNSTLLRNLNANYLIYYEIIKDAIKEKYEVIDFFGTSYNPKETDPEYGIYLFKKRLGGEYTEFIGEFDYVFKKFMYFIFNKTIPLYRNIVKKKNKIKNKK